MRIEKVCLKMLEQDVLKWYPSVSVQMPPHKLLQKILET